jgi:hypothetical protein
VLLHLAFVQDVDVVGGADGGEAVRDEQDRPAAPTTPAYP